jgi:MarR family transcriptional regulator, lower aerobic nicotinate degradation pathway regulator
MLLDVPLPAARRPPAARRQAESTSVPPDLAHDLGYLLWQAGKLSTRAAQAALADLGVTAREYAFLNFAEERGPLSQTALSEALGFDPSATVAVLDALERSGHTERLLDPSDRRVRLITITQRGREFLVRCRRAVWTATDRLLAEMPQASRLQLQELLRQVLLANVPQAVPGAADGRS